MSNPSSKPGSRRSSLTPAPVEFGAYVDQELQIKYYNCAPVKPRKDSLKAAETDDLKVSKDEVFGVVQDEGNKIHYYNCAPIKQKKAKKQAQQPIKKMFNRIFQKEGGTPSGSDLSLSSIGSAGSNKSDKK